MNCESGAVSGVANVLLVSVLSTFLFSSIFVESEYATFSMVRAPHANSAIKGHCSRKSVGTQGSLLVG